MKKSTVKAAKTPATPAKKTAAKIVKKPAASAAKAPAKKAAAPAVKPTAKLAPTVITAAIDIGFGNTLYVRGEGAGLSWDTGIAMDCVSDDQWSLSLPGASKTVTYKFLVNDLSWSAGPDYVAEPGSSVTLTPSF
jgi:hypothetical protein